MWYTKFNLPDELIDKIQDSKAHNFSSHSNAFMAILNLEEEKFNYEIIRNGVGGWIVVIFSTNQETLLLSEKLGFYNISKTLLLNIKI